MEKNYFFIKAISKYENMMKQDEIEKDVTSGIQ